MFKNVEINQLLFQYDFIYRLDGVYCKEIIVDTIYAYLIDCDID